MAYGGSSGKGDIVDGGWLVSVVRIPNLFSEESLASDFSKKAWARDLAEKVDKETGNEYGYQKAVFIKDSDMDSDGYMFNVKVGTKVDDSRVEQICSYIYKQITPDTAEYVPFIISESSKSKIKKTIKERIILADEKTPAHYVNMEALNIQIYNTLAYLDCFSSNYYTSAGVLIMNKETTPNATHWFCSPTEGGDVYYIPPDEGFKVKAYATQKKTTHPVIGENGTKYESSIGLASLLKTSTLTSEDGGDVAWKTPYYYSGYHPVEGEGKGTWNDESLEAYKVACKSGNLSESEETGVVGISRAAYFKKNKKTLWDTYDANLTKYDEAAKNFASMFYDVASFDKHINNFIYGNNLESTDPGNKNKQKMLGRYTRYLDLMLLIYHMTPKNSNARKYTKECINHFVQHYNSNDGEDFVELCIVPVASTFGKDGATNERYWYTGPAHYAALFGKGYKPFLSTAESNVSNTQLFTSATRDAYAKRDAEAWRALLEGQDYVNSKLGNNSSWFSKWCVGRTSTWVSTTTDAYWRYTMLACNQISEDRKYAGVNSGYTLKGCICWSRDYTPPDEPDPVPDPDPVKVFAGAGLGVGLKLANPKVIEYDKGSKTYKKKYEQPTASSKQVFQLPALEVTVGYEDNSKIEDLLEINDTMFKECDVEATLRLFTNVTPATVEGVKVKSPITGKTIDDVVYDGGDVTKDKYEIFRKIITKKELQNLIKGNSKSKFIITMPEHELTVATSTLVGKSYYVGTEINITGDITIKAISKADPTKKKTSFKVLLNNRGYIRASKAVKKKYGNSFTYISDLPADDFNKNRSDYCSETITMIAYFDKPDAPEQTTGSYYSSLEDPMAEIKQGLPGSEEFEAMAGVPTTRDLYCAVGASEFAVNMDVKELSGSGNYKVDFSYTCTQCKEVDAKCSYSCPGHTFSVPGGKIAHCTNALNSAWVDEYDEEGNKIGGGYTQHSHTDACKCKGKSITVYCNSASGSPAGVITCDSGCCSKSYSAIMPKYTPSSCDGWNNGTYGCVHNQQINRAHPHSHTYTGSITMPISNFKYIDIEALDLWMLDKAELQGNEELLSNPNLTLDPNLGYQAFYSQENYKSDNGRIRFKMSGGVNPGTHWGDRKLSFTDSALMLETDCNKAATKWMNEQNNSILIDADVISDYVVLGTSEGYQTLMYNDYPATQTKMTSKTFTTGNKTLSGNTIKWPTIPTFKEMWTDGNSAAKWKADELTYSGYNGLFGTPTRKMVNNNIHLTTESPAITLHNQPNMEKDTTNTDFKKNFQNLRLTFKNLNIIDSTDSAGNWDAFDDVEPVYNGEWDTGKAFVEMTKKISFKTTKGGTDWSKSRDWTKLSNSSTKLRREAVYSENHEELNDIVVHNPVSVAGATVIATDSRYDLRTQASLDKGADPVIEIEEEGCPGDGTCEHCELHCTVEPTLHDESCYIEIAGGMEHVGGNNSHVCTSSCRSKEGVKVLACDDPHHYEVGENYDPTQLSSHYDYGDGRCWAPCGNDENHKRKGTVVLPSGAVAQASDLFWRLDKEIQIYYPDYGDFAGIPSMWGIAECSPICGKGYTNNMNTREWMRSKFVALPVNVIDALGEPHTAGEVINLLELPDDNGYYTFYCVLANSEAVNARVEFLTIGNNAEELMYYSDNNVYVTNRNRDEVLKAKHTANKVQYVDVVGSIGSLTINDTGDFRFSNLFKQVVIGNEWLIPNVVPKVSLNIPNKVVADYYDVRLQPANAATKYHSTYGVTANDYGGKSFPYISLPLTAAKNNIAALRDQELRPGYKIYMDVETIGNYYGENYDNNNNAAIDIKVKGSIWTLEYDGSGINASLSKSNIVDSSGNVYPAPIDPETGLPSTDPIIVLYDNKDTSEDDLRTEGSH